MAELSFRLKPPATAEEAAAIIARLTAAMKQPGERFNPYGHMELSPDAIEQLARVRLGMLAMDVLAGLAGHLSSRHSDCRLYLSLLLSETADASLSRDRGGQVAPLLCRLQARVLGA